MIYFLGIQMSAIVAPWVCGWLFENYDPHWGFLAAGVGMVIGLAIYLIGKYSYPAEPFHKKKDEALAAAPRRRLSSRDWATVVLLIVLLPILALSILGNQEIFNAYLLWSEKSFDLNFFGVELPVSTLISLDAFISLFLMMAVIAFWRWYAKRRTEPVELTKMIIGTAIGALAPLALMGAAAMVESTGQKVPIAWGVLFHVINDLGFAMVLPVGLALYSRLAPQGLGGIMIAIYYLHIAGSNFLVGMLGAPNDAGVSFWLMIAGLVGGAAVVLLIMRVAFAGLLAPAFEKKPAAA
jgi:POT family proton-dependent oligopeptide transporter